MLQDISVKRACALTLLPSLVMTVMYYWVGSRIQGIPAVMLFFCVAMSTLFPFELYLIWKNRDVYQECFEKIAVWKIVAWAGGFFGYAGIVSITVKVFEESIFGELLVKWMGLFPRYFHWTDYEMIRMTYSRNVLIVSVVGYFILDGFICPIIEELYFRGFLTTRMKKYGWKAPIIVSLLFSFYHFWLPFENVFRICLFIPVAYVAYRKKNIIISILFHCMCNLLSAISLMKVLLF